MEPYFDIVIAGGGPAGLTAAVYARRAGRSRAAAGEGGLRRADRLRPQGGELPRLSPPSPARSSPTGCTAQAEALGARLELEEVLEIRPAPQAVATDYGAYTWPGR